MTVLLRRLVRAVSRKLAGIFAATIITILLSSSASINIWPAQGAGATLAFSPSSGTYAVGKSFTVRVIIDSGGGTGINASDGTLKFDPSLLAVSSVSKEGSIFNLWTSDPSFSNNAGTVTWSGGSPTPYSQSGGTIIAVSFRALKAGTANVSFESASVLAADGNGTNVYGGGGQGSYSLGGSNPTPDGDPEPITPPPTKPAPETNSGPASDVDLKIVSTTHPDQNKWYANKNPEFKWTLPPDAEGISSLIDQATTTNPVKASEGLLDSNRYDNVPDGANYFHIRVKTQSTGWSLTTHRRALIDTQAPDSFTDGLDQPDRGLPPRVTLQATDRTSGIDHFEIKINDRDVITVSLDQLTNNTYNLPPLLPGKYRAVFRALDKAGNAAELIREFAIEGQAKPEVTDYPQSLLEGDRFIVRGTADKLARVDIRVEQNNKVVSEELNSTNPDGTWDLVSNKNLHKGAYLLSVRQTTRANAESEWTEKIEFEVIGRPFLETYGLALIVLFICGIIGLIIYLYAERRRFEEKKQHLRRKTGDIKAQTSVVFQALDEEVEEKVHLLDPETAAKLGVEKLSILDVIERIKEALGISQDVINKEIRDVEEELE